MMHCVFVPTSTDVEPLAGVVLMDNSDVTQPETWQRVVEVLRGHQVDVVMRWVVWQVLDALLLPTRPCTTPCSDMAPNASGIHELDHARVLVSGRDCCVGLSLHDVRILLLTGPV